MGYHKERKNRTGTGFDTVDGEPLQAMWNLKIKYSLNGFIFDKMGFGQSKLGISRGGDILR
jgi:hypothetical protein